MGVPSEPITSETLRRLQLSLSSMGYRKIKTSWGKPVGFMLIMAEINESVVDFYSFTQGTKETLCWSKEKFAFDNETTKIDFDYSIALAEQYLHIQQASDCGEPSKKVFNFSTPIDLYHLDL